MKKEGIENRFIVQKYLFSIYKQRENTKYYLCCDGKYYSSEYAAKQYKFNTEKELEDYLSDNFDKLKKKYGDDIQIEKHKKYLCIGKCKELAD